MKRFLLSLSALTVLVVLLLYATTDGQDASASKPEAESHTLSTDSLPASLDELYPPNAEQPIFLLRMLGLALPFSGMVADMFENDPEHVQANFERLKAEYIAVSQLVPEWQEAYPMEPINALGEALATGNPERIMPAVEGVGAVCHQCHTAMMPRVQQKYRWGDFSAIRVTDPLTQETVDFSRLMLSLDTHLAGIHVDVAQGQRDNALKQVEGFNARFQVLKQSCYHCHNTERKYYTDESVQSLIRDLEGTLRNPQPDGVEPLLQQIGMESCLKCHLVHIPAAYAKLQQ